MACPVLAIGVGTCRARSRGCPHTRTRNSVPSVSSGARVSLTRRLNHRRAGPAREPAKWQDALQAKSFQSSWCVYAQTKEVAKASVVM